jgi:hypothetical protein
MGTFDNIPEKGVIEYNAPFHSDVCQYNEQKTFQYHPLVDKKKQGGRDDTKDGVNEEKLFPHIRVIRYASEKRRAQSHNSHTERYGPSPPDVSQIVFIANYRHCVINGKDDRRNHSRIAGIGEIKKAPGKYFLAEQYALHLSLKLTINNLAAQYIN